VSSARKHVVKVRIIGEEYSIRSEAPPERVRAVADYVDRIIRQVMSGGVGTVMESHRAAILAALQITDELFQAREDAAEVDRSLEALGAEVLPLLPPAKRASGSMQAVE
jgi:cell division protein ZapA